MTELNLKYTRPQEEIFNDPHRFKTIAKGRRFGFTHGISNHMILEMQEKTMKCLWGDTVTGNIKRYINRYWYPVLQQMPEEVWDWDKTNNIIYIGDSFCDFRSADRPENWEGYGYDLICLNEAGVILRNEYLWGNAVRPMLLDNPNSKAIIGGVPKGRNMFYDLCNQKSENWKHWTFTSYDNPLIKPSDIDELVEELKRIGGESFVRQEIFAEFIDVTELQYIEGEVIERAFSRIYPMGTERGAPKVAGVDFSRKKDRCVIAHRQGVKAHSFIVAHPEGKQWSVRFARKIVNETINEFGADHIFVDEGESGGGVIDILESWGYGQMITPIMFGGKADNDKVYGNKRFEMYGMLRIWLSEKGSLSKEANWARDLRRDLESITYGFTQTTGKLKLMPKAHISRSPDMSDALALTFAAPVTAEHFGRNHEDPHEKTNTSYVR